MYAFLVYCVTDCVSLSVGQAHYQLRSHGFTPSELDGGRREHLAMLTSFDDAKKIVNTKNFFNEAYKFNRRCFHPCVVPIEFVITYMMQSGNYILTPDFINNTYRKIRLDEASTLWSIIHDPKDTSVDQILNLIFDPKTHDNACFGKKSFQKRRYFSFGTSNNYQQLPLSTPTTTQEQQIDSDNGEEHDDDGSVVQVFIDKVGCPPSTPHQTLGKPQLVTPNLASKIINHCRNSTNNCSSRRTPNYPTSDLVSLATFEEPEENDDVIYYPPQLEEMTQIVRLLRAKHAMYAPPIKLHHPNSMITSNINNSLRRASPLLHAADGEYEPSLKKSRTNNYDVFCTSDDNSDDDEQFDL